jgi:hypothetical protein
MCRHADVQSPLHIGENLFPHGKVRLYIAEIIHKGASLLDNILHRPGRDVLDKCLEGLRR